MYLLLELMATYPSLLQILSLKCLYLLVTNKKAYATLVTVHNIILAMYCYISFLFLIDEILLML